MELVDTLQAVQHERGTAILLVEHDVEMVQRFASRLYVLDFGTLIATGPTDEVMGDAAVRRAYLGRSGMSAHRAPATRRCSSCATSRPAYGPFRALFGVSLEVHEGKAVALLGSNGAGKTTVARVCSGLLKPTSGRVAASRATTSPACGRTSSPGSGSCTRPRDARCSRRSPSRRTSPWASAARSGAPGCPPRSSGPSSCSPGSASGAGRWRARSRAVSSACSRSRACWCGRRELLICDELSLGPGARSSWRRCTGCCAASATPAPRCSLVEQHVRHALDLADDVVVLTKGAVVLRGAAAELRDELGERLLPAVHGEAV